MSDSPRRKLCELILWHDQHDAHSYNPELAVKKADDSVEEFRRSPWSWYSPREIVKWHGWFA